MTTGLTSVASLATGISDWVTPPPETHFLMDYVTRLTQ